MVPWVLIPLAGLVGAWLGMYLAGVVVTTHEPEEMETVVTQATVGWNVGREDGCDTGSFVGEMSHRSSVFTKENH